MKSKAADFSVLVLAAGEGTRMISQTPKVLHLLCEVPLLTRVLKTVRQLKPSSIGVVVGQSSDRISLEIGEIRGIECIRQKFQRGSGNAVQSAIPWIKKHLKKSANLIVVCGDTPLLTFETLKSLTRFHAEGGNSATVLSAIFSDPFGYGRIVKDSEGRVRQIVEEKDASFEERRIREVNSGVYCFNARKLIEVLPKLENHNAKKEYYLTDVLNHLYQTGFPAGSFEPHKNGGNLHETMGVNNRNDLAVAEELLQKKILKQWMEKGVSVLNPAFTYVGENVEIEPDTVLLPGTMITGKTRIGRGCTIGPHTTLEDCKIGNRVTIRASFIYGTQIGDSAQIGPYTHLRPGTVVSSGARVGNFTEIKNSEIGKNTKVSHLSYVGDSQIGSDVNVGAGVITCNFDGKRKHKTIVGSGSFVGSNVNLIAPVKVGTQTTIGAGSTITEDVPGGSLAIERTRQVVKRGWTKGKR